MKVSTSYSQFMMRTAIHSGAGVRAMIPDLFKGSGSKRVVLFSDKGLKQAGVIDQIVDIFENTSSGVELAGIFTDIDQDAGSECVNGAAKFYREVAADGMLAVGGGSVMDTVKGVKFVLSKGVLDVKEVIPSGFVNVAWPEANHIPIPHIAVPTTAGTGSEVSPIAVIYNETKKIKSNLIHPFINADMAILDPELTVGLPPFITAFTGFDALTHAIEALASPKATPITDAYALQAIRIIHQFLPQAVEDGQNKEARLQMLQASLMGITAFSFALSAIPVHNFAHAYGALFRIPHGLANAVFLPVVMEAVSDLYLPKVNELAQSLDVDVQGKDPNGALTAVIAKIKELQKQVNLPSTFSEYNISQESVKKTVPAVKLDPAGVAFPLPEDVILHVGKKVTQEEAVPVTD